ncbi:MAG: hypothetical protein AB7V59_11790 [Gammaproteobacteria bacterium]
MPLHCRPVMLEELPRCQALTAAWGRGVHTEATRAALQEVWRTLLTDGSLVMYVFEDDALAGSERIQGFVAAGFATDAWANEVLHHDRPYLCRQLVDATLRGERLLLPQRLHGDANGGDGVHAFGLDFGMTSSDWYRPSVVRWFPAMERSLRDWVGGWKLRSIVREMFGHDTYALARVAGYPLLRDLRRAVPADTPARERPYLCGTTRTLALRRPSSVAARLFLYSEPVFVFSPGEQAVLRLARDAMSDDAIAAALHVSPHTVKMRWRRVFDEVLARQPALLPDDASPLEHRRGSEKRRHLLAYLREHPEELRPRRARRTHPDR